MAVIRNTLGRVVVNKLKNKKEEQGLEVPTPNTSQNQTIPVTTQEETKKNLGFYQDEKGNATGIEKNGKTYLGKLSPDEVQSIIASEEKKKIPAQYSLAEQARVKNLNELSQAAAQNIGLTPEQIQQAQLSAQETPIDYGQAITAGTVGAGGSIIRAAGTGLAAGAAAGAIGGSVVPVVGTTVGAVGLGIAGALTGIVSSIYSGINSNIQSQQKGEIAATKDVLAAAKTNMRQLAILANQDPINAHTYIQAYNQQLANVYAAQSKLKLETQGNLNKFREDGTQDLSDFELFLEPNGLADLYGQRLRIALNSGGSYQLTENDLLNLETDLTAQNE